MNIGLLIKISQEKYIDEIQKQGKFYCNTLKYFRELENDGYIADPYEGAKAIQQIYNIKFTIDDNILTSKKGFIVPSQYESGNIFCMYSYNTDDLNLNNSQPQKANINIESQKLGDYALLIDPTALIERLNEKLNEYDVEYEYGLVEYKDFKKYTGNLSPFNKSNIYSNQSEFRILIKNKSNEPFIFYLGDLSDISYKCKVEELDSLEVEVFPKK